MSFGPEHQEAPKPKTEAKAAPETPIGSGTSAVVKGLGAFGWIDDVYKGAINAMGGWGMNPHTDGNAGSKQPHQDPYVLAGMTSQAKGDSANLTGALESAAKGETVAEQARKVSGPVKMTAADALNIAGQMSPDQQHQNNRDAIQQANAGDGGYQSPFVTVALSGIRNNQDDAEKISKEITGDATPHGYAAYGRNDRSYANETGDKGIVSPGDKSPKGYLGADYADAANDVAAVTQYAAAADLGIKLTPNKNGDGKTVSVDWQALSKMEVSADMGMLGGKINYDNPAAVAQNGYEAVLADIKQRNGDPKDMNQFISLTGHSGGGQSSFYTALKLASSGYKNISLVGVDMAMTPHEREVLETLGVQVTNITSNNKDKNGNASTSEIGEVIRTGMGGGQNFYDLNVERKNAADPFARHDIANDPNVMTTVRFAQYLDAIGQHGKYTDPALYQQFLDDSNGKGNQTSAGAASNDLVSKMTDQRNLPGADANSADPAQASSVIEKGIKMLGGNRIADGIKGAGTAVDNTIDKAGDSAQSWIGGMFSKAGNFFGGLANSGLDLLGKGANAVGGFIGNGLDKAGDVVSGLAGGAGDVVNWLGNTANKGLDLVGNGISTVGNWANNGLHSAGDTAKSWLGHIPLVGDALGNVADKGLGMLGNGVGAVSNFVGGGLDKAGDVVQSGGGMFSGAMHWLGDKANQGMDMLGNGAKTVGGFIGNGLDKAGDAAQSGISGAANSAGGWLGGLVNSGIDWVGHGIGGMIHNVGDWAGQKVDGLVTGLQGIGIDTSQIKGTENYGTTNPSETRGWRNMLTDPNETDPTKLQHIDVPAQAPAAQPTTQPSASTDHLLFDPAAHRARNRTPTEVYAD